MAPGEGGRVSGAGWRSVLERHELLCDLRAAVDASNVATCPESIFGPLVGDMPAQLAQLKALYHQIARTVHPDRFAGGGPDALNAADRKAEF